MTDVARIRITHAFAILAIVFGIAARVANFDGTPPGLNQDEASIGYEAWSLLHHGIDRNGVSWPVHLISWGSGQNALYAYAAMPFIAAFGLSPLTTRLPMLIAGLLSLPLVWLAARRLFGARAAWGATAMLALSPWHIMLSRWGLESNILPFVFIAALACLVRVFDTRHTTIWLMAACAIFGLSLYAYGPAYLAVPLFLLGALGIGLASRSITWRMALIGLIVFALVTLPIALFVAVNTFKLNTIVIAGVSMPRLPATPRFESQLAAGPLAHVGQLWQLLVAQRDGTLYNVTDPYGVMYSVVFFALAVAVSFAVVVFAMNKRWPPQRMLVALWLVACLPTGLVQEPNINRINLLLMGLVFAAGIGLGLLDTRVRGALLAGLVATLVLFGFFARDYFTMQREKIAPEFFDGLLPALAQAQTVGSEGGGICVTGKVNMPYIYALFAERTDPHDYLRTVQYVDATAPFREVTAFGRYTFGLDRCDFAKAKAVVAKNDEQVPDAFRKEKLFALFDVYVGR